jgi:hypothetical protein
MLGDGAQPMGSTYDGMQGFLQGQIEVRYRIILHSWSNNCKNGCEDAAQRAAECHVILMPSGGL